MDSTIVNVSDLNHVEVHEIVNHIQFVLIVACRGGTGQIVGDFCVLNQLM